MKKTMLTCKTLDRFEAEYNTTQYTPDEIEKVEFAIIQNGQKATFSRSF